MQYKYFNEKWEVLQLFLKVKSDICKLKKKQQT